MITDSSRPYLVCTCASHALLLATYVMHSGTFLSLDQLVLHNYIVPVWSLACAVCLQAERAVSNCSNGSAV